MQQLGIVNTPNMSILISAMKEGWTRPLDELNLNSCVYNLNSLCIDSIQIYTV